MKIIKVFNNNAVALKNEKYEEIVATGPGIGYKKKVGDIIDDTMITQKFFIQDEKKKSIYELVKRTPYVYFEISQNILEYARKNLKKEINLNVLVSLTDHISFAIERAKSKITIPNLILNEIRALYKDELNIGIWAINYIEEKTYIKLQEDEAGYIAIYIIDATNPSKSAIDMIDTVKDIVYIIENHYQVKLDIDSLNYFRLITHLKFFIQRIKAKDFDNSTDHEIIYDLLARKNKQLLSCIHKIERYVKKEFNIEISKSEIAYLMIHLTRVFNRNRVVTDKAGKT